MRDPWLNLSSRIKMLWKLPIFQYHYKIMVIKVWDFAGGSLLKNKPANTGVWSLVQEDFTSDQLVSQSDSLWPHGLQHTRPLCPSPTPRAYSNSCPSDWWCHLTISSSVIPFSSLLKSVPESGSLPMSWFFASGGQSIGVLASALVLPMNIQDWVSLGLTSWISLQSKGLSRVFFNTTLQKHQLFGVQLSL